MAEASKRSRAKSILSHPSEIPNSVSPDKPLDWTASSHRGDGGRGKKVARTSESGERSSGSNKHAGRGHERKRDGSTAGQAVMIDISSDEDEECRVLESDPFLSPTLKTSESGFQNEDIAIITESGQVACRDYPHPRYLCANFPFSTTPHHTCCSKCYCYVCNVLAPCKKWKGTRDRAHCNASDQNPKWKDMRRSHRS